MSIISWQFALLVAITLAIYYWLPPAWRSPCLLIASYIFVATFGVVSLCFLFGLTCANFFISVRLAASPKRRHFWLLVGIALNVLLLILYRLCDSVYGARAAKLVLGPSIQTEAFLQFILPIGFLFYGLQAIAYLVDLSNERTPVETSFVKFALFLGYFPKLLSGPIERSKTFLPKLQNPRKIDAQTIRLSFTLILVGLVRKIVIADVLLRAIPDGFIWMGRNSTTPLEVWLLIITFAFVLYNDFAGYTNIVQGVSLLFGIELSPNFRQPFFSRSFTEFWTRWHISLSEWLRDYIFFPLSRWLRRRIPNSNHWLNITLPPLFTMLASGFWHGLSASFLIWGGLHGLHLVLERIKSIRLPSPPSAEQPKWRQIANCLFVFVAATLAWVPFHIQSLMGNAGALEYWRALFIPANGHSLNYWVFISLVPIALSLWIDWMQYRAKSDTVFLGLPRLSRAFLIASSILLIVAFSIANSSSVFIYQGF